MHSRSSGRGSKSDMDVDQPPKGKVNYATIDERKSEESDDSKKYKFIEHFRTSIPVEWSKLS